MSCLLLPPVPASVGAARRWAAPLLPPDLPPDLRDSVVLVLSELLTNAVALTTEGRAAAAEDIEVEVFVDPADGHVTVAVTDPSDQPLPPAPVAVEAGADHGRGLLLLDALAHSHGWSPRACGGKSVWAQFRRRAAAPRRNGPRRAAAQPAGCACA
ncbi:ATP-binding protein [Streptomyces sp. CA-146814]|uniref:ATP-binding protein n=1 Tax=Streptomyces sp. CA-146814 TaxID=3240053 RepID=UPI003D9265E4